MFGISAGAALAVGVGAGALLGSKAPDTSGINNAAEQNAQVAQEELDWNKQLYADQAPDRAAAIARSGAVSDAELAAMQEATREAQSTNDFQNRTLRPLQQSLVDEANNYDSEGKREQLAGLALGDVNTQFASARDQATRQMARSGVNVSDGNYGSEIKQLALGQALAGADAENKARTQATVYGHALKTDAAAALSGLPANSATQAGLALSSGNSSVGNAQVPLQVAQQGAAQMNTGFNGAVNAYNSSGNLYGLAAGVQQKQDQANMEGLAGLGKFVGYMSDKRQKTARKPMKTEVALAAARCMPVDSWKYKRGSAANDGGKTHIGPMAQDVRKAAGDAVAPGGKMIDAISMHGLQLAAIQELDKGQKRLESKVAGLAAAKPSTKSRRAA